MRFLLYMTINNILGYRFIKVTGLSSESYLYNVLKYAVYGFVFVCYYANEIKFKPNNILLRLDVWLQLQSKQLILRVKD